MSRKLFINVFDVKGEEKENLTEEKLLKGYSSSLSDETIFSAF